MTLWTVAHRAPLSRLGLNKRPAVQTEIWLGEWEVFYKTYLINLTGKVLLLSSSNRGKQYNRDHSKKIRDTKGTFHAKMGSIKKRNVMDLTDAEDIKKRWQEYTEELYKKHLHDPDNHEGVITDLEPDNLECEVKWALESITTNKRVEVMEFQLSHFKS